MNIGKINFKLLQKRWRVSLFLACFFALWLCILSIATVWREWIPGKEDASCAGVFETIALFYVIQKQFLYMFLYDRAKIVHLALSMGRRLDRYMLYLRWVIFHTITVGISISFYWAAWVAFSGSLDIIQGDCIFFSIYPVVAILFAISDFGLAGGMSILFIGPLIHHRNVMRTNKVNSSSPNFARPLERMITVNARLSTICVLSGLIGLIGVSTTNFIASRDPTSLTYLRAWGAFLVSWDYVLGIAA